MNTYIGIDNGLTGAIAALIDGELRLYEMPVLSDGKKRRVDVLELQCLLFPYLHNAIVLYESPGGSQGVKPAISMADSFARVESVLILDGYKREPINAIKWQRTFWSRPKMPKGVKFDTKAAALNKAKQLWPEQDWRRNEKCKVPHDGFVDAALIAMYGRRTYS